MEGPPVNEKNNNPFLETRDKYKESASELQKNTAEVQAAKYETILYRLMKRSGDNTDLVNALNEFLGALEHQSMFGNEDDPLSQKRVEELAKFVKEKAEELRPDQERGW
ncbi:hypothetical protein A2661_02415 [Candidatus Giovannonibacteria bacterium RIFCSPHIGHO2_01_FULL_45_24]|uniref:Uncharacterized protein n=1 Tax=Candidatus Giovannonibacteria bacterium RIFCSPLOWO2_01_FULL_46_32 TaxID=1798353 RepID=A0A1F5XG72_9BACT|nr:MAG: hypothetical protein A2661_02415 [Candidatus Giovannonibacteria bacterium RIFCSPHIGHO2_01_FULL_45_24]OGF86857.1 MAG: hypothetical protein A3B19_02185 [Candidatus Giovannonibacteria bacterium RIFCSPLOWO2_01_FULL_46_32]